MGFHDAEWAYGLGDLKMRERTVLAALCFRTDDRSHQTFVFVSQATLATMLGASTDYVLRALRELEKVGAIVRERRSGAGGYRSSDLITVNHAFTARSQVGQEPTRRVANKADSVDLTRSEHGPTQTPAVAEEITRDHPEDHSVGELDCLTGGCRRQKRSSVCERSSLVSIRRRSMRSSRTTGSLSPGRGGARSTGRLPIGTGYAEPARDGQAASPTPMRRLGPSWPETHEANESRCRASPSWRLLLGGRRREYRGDPFVVRRNHGV
ncbi:hypothetical protein SAMN04487847_0681 [Microbacterium sp. cf332]|nr:hypothetical protein SAMN04487847_0681 [Microbacterium sp. cf332]